MATTGIIAQLASVRALIAAGAFKGYRGVGADITARKDAEVRIEHFLGDGNVAARIRQQVRESDTLARVGGDEFIVILPGIARREEAEMVARKIIDAIAVPFQPGSPGRGVGIGASIGIAMYPADARDADALVKAGDAAMYSAKITGGSYFPVTGGAVAVVTRSSSLAT